MVKIFKLLGTLFLTAVIYSCGSNVSSNGNSDVDNRPMQYTISISDDFIFPVKTIKVFECIENGDKVHENEFVIGAGDSKTFTAQPKVQKVKVYVSLRDPLSPFKGEYNGWLPLVYYLSPGESKVIRIDNDIEQHRYEP